MEGNDTEMRLSAFFLDLCLSIVIELLPNGIFVIRYYFYKKDKRIDFSMLNENEIKNLRDCLFKELNDVLLKLNERRALIILQGLRTFVLSKRLSISYLGRFWVFNVRSIAYNDKLTFIDTLVFMWQGNVLNVISGQTSEFFLHSHSYISYFVYALCVRKFTLILEIIKFLSLLWNIAVLLFPIISIVLVFFQALSDMKIEMVINYLILILLISLTLIVARKVLIDRLRQKVAKYLNEN